MQCEQARALISAYIDDALPDTDRRAVAAHVETCPHCAALNTALRADRRALSDLGRVALPSGLQRRVFAQLAAADPIEVAPGEKLEASQGEGMWNVPAIPAVSAGHGRRWRIPTAWMRQAAVLVLACGLSSAATWWEVTSTVRTNQVEHDILAAHVRSLLQDAPIQIASTDSHVVKPWLVGRVDFAPEVRDLSAEGFPLLGGRLDYVDGRRVAVMVYRRRLHTINVFAWLSDGAGSVAPHLVTRNGYSLITWTQGGVTRAAISDLSADELWMLQKQL